jgi:hypothetical protein
MYVWMDGWMDGNGWLCSSLVPEHTDRFYSHSVFKSSSIRGLCPVNLKIAAPKLWAIRIGPRTKKGGDLTIFIKFQEFVETTSVNNIAHVVPSGK